jgi:hypothetical protein
MPFNEGAKRKKMKKLIFILLCLPLIFSTCKKEDDEIIVSGCTNPSAFNYNPNATVDDGSCCLVAGCTDPTALNYNAQACSDDGSCVPVYTDIPDINFETALITLGYDNVINGKVLTANIDTITSLYLGYKDIVDLTGIERFTALTSLDVNNNDFPTLNLSHNTALTYLNADNCNSLYSVNVSNNTALTYLNISSCNNVNFTSINVSNNTALTQLYCNSVGWGLQSLNVSNNPMLSRLECNSNDITTLDLSNNINLLWLKCRSNNLTYVDLRNTSLHASSIVDLRFNPNLHCVDVDNPGITSSWDFDSQTSFSVDCGF